MTEASPFQHAPRWFALLLAPVLLLCANCTAVGKLNDGQPTMLGGDYADYRNNLQLELVALPDGALEYVPVGVCEFRSYVHRRNEEPVTNILQIGVVQRGPGLQVTQIENQRLVSTIFIEPDGRMLDFNVVDQSVPEGLTPETFQAEARTTLEQLGENPDSRSANYLNISELIYPHFIASRPQVGDIVATVGSHSDESFANYRYRGLTEVDGARAMVLDLVRTFPNAAYYGEVVVGFTVIDLATMLPIFAALELGLVGTIERRSCAP